jgi:enterochelin esterase family protein
MSRFNAGGFAAAACRRAAPLFILASLAATRGATATSDGEGAEAFDSPRIAALAARLRDGDAAGSRAAVDEFCEGLRGRAPLVEPVAGDARASWITFLWRGDATTRRVGVLGGPATGDYAARLTRLKGTDLWYRTDRIPSDSRLVYRFLIDLPDTFPRDPAAEDRLWKAHPPRNDPLNPHPLPTGGSLAELPDAPAQPWLQRLPGVPNHVADWLEKALADREIREYTVRSEFLKQERTYAVYTPPGYGPEAAAAAAAGEPCGLLVLFDGNGCRQTKGNTFPVGVILDNLILAKKVRPLVAVFVYQTERRDRELSCSEAFADFVALELVPAVRARFRVSADPSRATVAGMSLGGLMSAYCGFRHPDVFGNVLSMSGSYQWFPGAFEGTAPPDAEPGWLTRQFVTAPRLPLRFYLTAGRFEHFYPFSLLAENRRIRDVLRARGYDVNYSEFNGGHDPVCWRGPFVDGLVALAGAAPPPPHPSPAGSQP